MEIMRAKREWNDIFQSVEGKKLECHARWKYFPKRKAKNPRLCRETHVEGMPLQQACSEAVEEGPDM